MKIESLDDLFDEGTKEEEKETVKVGNVNANEQTAKSESDFQEIDDFFVDEQEVPNVEKKASIQEDEDTYDLQKELEAKFDELFGPMDE